MPEYLALPSVHKPHDSLSTDAGRVVLVRVPPPEMVFHEHPLLEWAVLDGTPVLRRGHGVPAMEQVVSDALAERAAYILGRATLSGTVTPLSDQEAHAVREAAAYAVNTFWR